MPFVKVVKNKAYFKRFQVKYRRRREGKTDYRARKRLITQDKNKYNSPKYRMVVRFSNKYVICQIVAAELVGDKVLCAASSAELPRYGLKVGLKNFAAAYCTGLLLARRMLTKVGLEDLYEGNTEIDGEVVSTDTGKGNSKRTYYVEELDDDKRPFKALLDVGIKTCTTGNRVFAVMKGATDGGLDVPHSNKRFAGYDKETKEYDADAMKDRIFGQHISEYMEKLQDEDNAKYNELFSDYIKAGVEPDGMEDLYVKVHEAIREAPEAEEKEEVYECEDRETYKKKAKQTYEERKAKMEARKAAMEEDEEEEEEEDEEEDA